MSNPFTAPAAPGGDGVKVPDLEGHLVIVYATSYEQSITTQFGDKDAVRVNVADVDTGELHTDALWFAGYIVGSLKGNLRTPVLARIGRGQAKPGQSPPWMLVDATSDADAVTRASAWLNANPGALSGQALASPAPAVPAAAPVAAAPAASSLV